MLQHIIFAADQYTFHKACITAMLLINGTNALHEWKKFNARMAQIHYTARKLYTTLVI